MRFVLLLKRIKLNVILCACCSLLENLVGEQFSRLFVPGRLRTYRVVGWLGYESAKYSYERLG